MDRTTLSKATIKELCAPAHPTAGEIDAVFYGWQRYFWRYGVVDQQREFNEIIRSRVQSGSVSLIAPFGEPIR